MRGRAGRAAGVVVARGCRAVMRCGGHGNRCERGTGAHDHRCSSGDRRRGGGPSAGKKCLAVGRPRVLRHAGRKLFRALFASRARVASGTHADQSEHRHAAELSTGGRLHLRVASIPDGEQDAWCAIDGSRGQSQCSRCRHPIPGLCRGGETVGDRMPDLHAERLCAWAHGRDRMS